MNQRHFTNDLTVLHSYCLNVALDVGITQAVVFESFLSLVRMEKAKSPETDYGDILIKCPSRVLSWVLPELSQAKIRNALTKLVKNEYLLTIKQEDKWDHTLSYALSTKAIRVFLDVDYLRE